ncbi:MAG: hypothetical protein LLG04_00925 [Parachlamydia sp.]|nr:hypothetical protein [Parachlamydia sp.]
MLLYEYTYLHLSEKLFKTSKEDRLNILLPGQYPRSEALIAATRDVERHRMTDEEVAQIRADDMVQFKNLQEGFPYTSTGLFHWQDLMRPFASVVESARPGGLQRFFETNTFWRVLEGNGKGIDEEALEQGLDGWFFGDASRGTNLLFTLPFLPLFHSFSNGFTLEQSAAILEKVAIRLLSFPNKALCFFEPTIGFRPLKEEEKRWSYRLLEKIRTECKAPLFLYQSFYSIEAEREFFFSLPVDGFGIDFYANSLKDSLSHFPSGKKLLAGIISTETTHIETENSVREFTLLVQDYVSLDQLLVCPSGPAEFLPRNVMDQKVENMKEILHEVYHA